jgi:hypothetical protein
MQSEPMRQARSSDLLGAIHLRRREARSRFFTLHRDTALQAKRILVFRSASWVFTLLLCQIRVTNPVRCENSIRDRSSRSDCAIRASNPQRSRSLIDDLADSF